VWSHAGEERPLASNPKRWSRPSTRWVTAWPVVYERYVRKGLTLADLATWCAWAQLPAPVRFAESPVPFLEGAADLRPQQVFRDGRPTRPYRHLQIEFAEPVRGPIALGRMRHFGLGLLVPVPTTEVQR
jgi:CRISPR-associated protein Csb2